MSLTFWMKTAAAFIFRSGRTTLALGSLIAVAVGNLIFISAIATGVNDCMIQNSTGLYSGQITGTDLPTALSPQRLEAPGLDRVLKRFTLSGRLLAAKERGKPWPPEVSVSLVALDPEREKETTFLWKKITEGRFLSPDTTGILISSRTALALDTAPGEILAFSSPPSTRRFTVQGVFETGIPQMDQNLAFCTHDSVVPPPETWQAAVFLLPGVSESQIIEAWADNGIDTRPFRTWQDLMPDLTQLIDLNRISMGFVVVLVLGVVAFATACAFAISIISRLREYGIMKTMGVTAAETALMIFLQVVLLNLAAAAGILLGMALVFITAETGIDLSAFTSHNRYFVVSGVIRPRMTFFSLVLPPGLCLSFCLFAAAWPVMTVVRRRPAPILRSS